MLHKCLRSAVILCVLPLKVFKTDLYIFFFPLWLYLQLLQQLKRLICDLCRLYNLPQHPDVEMLDQPLPAGPITQDRKVSAGMERSLRVCRGFETLTFHV